MATRALDTRARRYDPAETRQRVLEAANLLFSTKGYACTGTADIARAADVSEGSIFYHFGSKKNLLVDIGKMYGERMIAVMQGDDALEDLDPGMMVSRCIEFCVEHKEWEALTGESCCEGKPKTMMAAEAEPFYHASREVTVAWVAEQMTARMAKQGITGVNIPVAASLTYAVVGETIEAVLSTDDPDRRRAVMDETVRFIRAACGYKSA
ncbi:TetR/AcrR family transcriptional regulator [Polymorphobacter sp. PAMC 29334]|uniref:TetR/AcrR family transcriptional regulator n=1 Tax=Polymorphobacter sp. PAMC 29334 TaxID=2862331 RepID=UPI001C664F07|nr:TetR/AcrR family transcriptional regulator [Polymorphobacter sp. PAMC 29334]QYE36203.1 TetR/AcrR family transcriptional regulator [Polymorphobacter sp. PAMC 29334]